MTQESGFDSRQRQEIILFFTASILALAFYSMVPEGIFPAVKQSGCNAYYSPSSSAEVKNAWSYISIPPYAFMTTFLIKHRENFAFAFVIQLLLQYPVPIIVCSLLNILKWVRPTN
jgi:hypothetical protein